MMFRRLRIVLTAALLLTAPAASASPLVADLSDHLIKITTGFTGTDVLLFGATDGPGQVIVVVRGPDHQIIVRRKERAAGIWVNGANRYFESAPSFYAVSSSAPVEKLLPLDVRRRHRIGVATLNVASAGPDADAVEYGTALVRKLTEQGLYQRETGIVRFLGNQLFRVDLHFPANVPTGTYSVQVFLVRDGKIASAQTTPLFVSKVGAGAFIFRAAQNQPALYGLAAILIALLAGWIAATVFRKG